jgi:chitinase
MKSFIQAAFSGVLASGALSNLTPIPLEFWQTVWNVAHAALGEYPPIGSSIGASPNTPNDRIMECFGRFVYLGK